MTDPTFIILGGNRYSVQPLTFGSLKHVLHRVNAAHEWASLGIRPLDQGGNITAFFDRSADGLDAAIEMIAAATGMPRSEVESIPANVFEAAIAIETIGILSGVLVPKKEAPQPGEAHRGKSTGTKSTGS